MVIENPAPARAVQEPAATASGGSRSMISGHHRLTIASALLLSIAIVASAAVILSSSYHRVIADNERNLSHTTLMLAKHIEEVFERIGAVQNTIARQAEALDYSDAAGLHVHLSQYPYFQKLRDHATALQFVEYIAIADANGRLINSSRTWPSPNTNFSDREYFKTISSNPNLTSHLGNPFSGRIVDAWLVPVTRRISGPNKEFWGTITALLDVKSIETSFKDIILDQDSAITLLRSDGMLLARFPAKASDIGRQFPNLTSIKLVSEKDHGVAIADGKISGVERMIASRRVAGNHPLVVAVGKPTAAIFADWRQSATYIVVLSLLGIAATWSVAILFIKRFKNLQLLVQMQAEREKTEELQRESQRFIVAINNMSQGLAMFDASAQIVASNERFAQMLRLSAETVKYGTILLDILSSRAQAGSLDGDPFVLCSKIQKQIAKGEMASYSIETRDGRIIREVNQPLANGGWVATFEDITIATKAEIALRDSERLFSDLFGNSADAFIVSDAEGIIRLANSQAHQMFGYQPDELIGQSVDKLLPKDQREQHANLRSAYLSAPTRRPMGSINKDIKGLRKDGSKFLADIGINPIDYSGKKMICATVRNITDQRLAEEERNQNRELVNQIIDNVPAAIVVKNVSDRRIVYINRATQQLWCRSRYDIIGKTVSDFLSVELARKITADDNIVMRTEKPLMLEARSSSLPGAENRLLATKKLIVRALDESPKYILSIVEDVTERKNVEAQLRQSQKMEAIGNLTGGVAHDFNNLLTVMIGNLDMLLEESASEPNKANTINIILEAALRGSELTKQMLAFSRRQPLQPKCIDVNALADKTVRLLSRTLGENIHIDVNKAPGPCPVMVDEAQLESALVNISINARDAMPGGGMLTISTEKVNLTDEDVAMRPGLLSGEHVVVRIADTGIGMPSEVANRIFEPFFTTKETGKGTGLGLSMVYGFVKQSNGHIGVTSELGKGTTFELFFPAAAEAGLSANAGPANNVDTQSPGSGQVVLAVDDQPEVLATAVAQLKSLGFEVIEATDAMSALEKLSGGAKIDLLFTDIVMPGGMSGVDLANIARAEIPDLKVLYASGFPAGELNGSDEFSFDGMLLAKPYRKQELAKAVAEVLAAA